MGSLLFVLPCFSIHLFLLLLTLFISKSFSLCNPHESSALLQFKNSFSLNASSKPDYPWFTSISSFSESWKNNTDCCEWDGVTCDDVSDYVIGVDLSCNNLKGELHPNSTIFQLTHLQQLNLAFNDFSWSTLHDGIGDLVSLTHLNLSYCDLTGNIPSTISHLSKLVSFDLSSYTSKLKFNPFTWKKLILNATNLRELNLDRVDMSSIEGSSLSILKNLSSSLVSLSLSDTGLQGYLSSEIPYFIDQLKSLTFLDLSWNIFNGMLPPSLWNLTQLTYLNLAGNNFEGQIPSLLSTLTNLTFLHLGFNKFSGNIPNVFENLIKLEYLSLSGNKLVGPIPSEIKKKSKLSIVYLRHNMLNGTIPHWCYYLPSLLELSVNDNQLTGFIGDFSTHSLEYLDLSNNNFHGHFPNSIFKLQNLTILNLSSTNLSGVVHFHQFLTFKNLEFLNLSHNSALSINIDSKAKTLPPHFQYLSSTNSNRFPKFLAPLPNLEVLDLSNSNIHGKISKWFQSHLLSSLKKIELIDLSFNKLQGDIPVPPNGIQYLLLSNNNFTGDIPLSLCNASSLEVLNLAHNNLTGTVPQCLGTFPFLSVLDMQMNNFNGSMPRTFSKENSFETIKLNGNQLEGPVPRSLARCSNLEILDLGDNNIEDAFPNWLETLQELRVLRLRSK
ncbi:unnamed protein product [Lathyrus sativus]|nr:unnamed protein product [Lathyrus sativus]